MKPQIRTILNSAFRTGIMLKAIDGVLEIIGRVCPWPISSLAMNSVVRVLVEHELSHDTHDCIAIHLLRKSVMLLSSNRLFASMYLLSRGAVKVFLVVALWRNAQLTYPLTIFYFSGFSTYQMYRYSHPHSIPMLPPHDFRRRYHLPDVDGVAAAEGRETITDVAAIFGSLAPCYRSPGMPSEA
jgi:uncharacterized membrane protein